MLTAQTYKTELTKEEQDELRELSALARQARGSWYPPEIADASERLSRLLNEYLEAGISYGDLAEATGIKWRSIKSRLARHGYIDAPPSQQSKIYRGPLTMEDRKPKCDHDPERWRERHDKTGRLLRIECLDCRRERDLGKKPKKKAKKSAKAKAKTKK